MWMGGWALMNDEVILMIHEKKNVHWQKVLLNVQLRSGDNRPIEYIQTCILKT